MAETRPAPGLLDRTWQGLRGALRGLSGCGNGAPSDADRAGRMRLVERMHECLEARGGEVTARARAVELGRYYLALSKKGRRRFLARLANEFDTDRAAVDAALARLTQASSDGARGAAE